MDERAIGRIYARRRRQAEEAALVRAAQIYGEHPKLQRLEEQIERYGALLASAIIRRKTTEESELRETLSNLQQQRIDYLVEREIPLDFDRAQFLCPYCQDTGKQGLENCRCYREVISQIMVLPEEEQEIKGAGFAHFDFDLFSPERVEEGTRSPREEMSLAYRVAQRLVEDFDGTKTRNLYLSGKTGTGKTFLAGSMIHALREAGIPALFLTANRILDLFREHRLLLRSFRPDPERLDRVERQLEDFRQVDFLVLDDLGREDAPDEMQQVLLQLLGDRREPRFATWITSNLNHNELQLRYDERISSRIASQFTLMNFRGEDLRVGGKRKNRSSV